MSIAPSATTESRVETTVYRVPDYEISVVPLDPDGYNVVVESVWGKGRTSPPDGEFVDVAVSSWMSCGVRVGGSLSCWPDYRFGEGDGKFGVPVPEGEFTQVALRVYGDEHDLGGGCALRASGELVCWADPGVERDEGVVVGAPSGRFVDVRGMALSWCAVRIDGGVVCWGDGFRGHEVLADAGYVRLTAEHCALDTEGRVRCWGWNDPPVLVSPDWLGPLSDHASAIVRQEDGHSEIVDCGIAKASRSLVCWAKVTGERRVLEGFEGTFVDIDSAPRAHLSEHAFCAARFSGGVDCRNSPNVWETRMHTAGLPSGEFRKVAASLEHACGIRVDRSVSCWGSSNTRSSIG